jgi:hypothetical protein
MSTQALDIRIVEIAHEQPTLFGPPVVTCHYTLVDWHSDEPLQDEQGKPYHLASLPEAERATYAVLAPGLRRMAEEFAESEVIP